MKSESSRKSFITNITRHLLSLGAEADGESDKSNSAYFKYGGAHIRVSDHFNPDSRMENLNIVTAGNDSKSVIMSVNGYPMVMPDTRSVKTFLTNFCEFYSAFDFTKACSTNAKIVKLEKRREEANGKLVKVLDEVCKAEKTLRQKARMIEAADKKIAEKGKELNSMFSTHGMSLEGLSKRQLAGVAKVVNTYRGQNKNNIK